MDSVNLRNFLVIPYDELEALNLEAKQKAIATNDQKELREHYLTYLEDEKRLKAVTLCFSDLEGRFHMLDYDKKYIIKSDEMLTFDAQPIRGFKSLSLYDLRLQIDWSSFRWMPSDVFGPGKVIVFADICVPDGSIYPGDFRGRLKQYLAECKKQHSYEMDIGVECQGFLFKGLNAEQSYQVDNGFELVSGGGYFHSLPKDPLRIFIDSIAEVQRAMGFENEKDHPGSAPSQFELNYRHCNALLAADQFQLYKLIARQVAQNMGNTASFLPQPVSGVSGSSVHCNISIAKAGKNLFFDESCEHSVSKLAWECADRLVNHANDTCLVFSSSVNSYRRYSQEVEMPNHIKASATDRKAIVRVPPARLGSARIEYRAAAPDMNPYLSFYALLKVCLEGQIEDSGAQEQKRQRTRFLPSNFYDAIRLFKSSEFMGEIMSTEIRDIFAKRKSAVADRCPREHGSRVKTSEVAFHHEVTNQWLWNKF